MAQGGIRLLSTTAANAGDPQTLRMVAGAIANLCGNGKIKYPIFIGLVGIVICYSFTVCRAGSPLT